MPTRYESSLVGNTETVQSGGTLVADGMFIATIPSAPREYSAGEAVALTLQRTIEVVIAAIALIITSPVMLIIGAIVRLDSSGPALFRQLRVGINGRPFWFYKFRTLYADAKERFPELYAYDYSPQEVEALQFKREEDPRVTRVGRWLRKSTLDELPNFWNVMKGEVAFVGPRPEIPEMLKHYTREQLLKFAVRPGITGLAQTHGRGNLAFQETIEWDLEYVRNKSPWLDIKIIGRTFRMLITLDGAF